MTRLTQELRATIAQAAVRESFKKRYEVLEKEEHAIGMVLYKYTYSPEVLRALKKIPQNWFRMDSCLRFNCAGYDLRLKIKEAVPVPYSDSCARLGNIPAGEESDRARKWAEEKDALDKASRQAGQALLTMLNSVNTIKQLQVVWPDGAQFYSRYMESAPGSALPAVQVDEVNKLLGLVK